MIFILIAGLGFFALVGYQGYVITAGEWINKNTFSGIVQWPTYLSRIWIPLGSLMIILRMLIELVKRVKTLLTN